MHQHRKRIGLRIKALREQQNLSSQQIAEAIKMSENNYLRIEEGKFSVSVDKLEEIAVLLGTRVNLILYSFFFKSV